MSKTVTFSLMLLILILGLSYLSLGESGSLLPFAPIVASDGFSKTLKINGTTVRVDVANTKEKREVGLSKRKLLPIKTGMLFVFDESNKYGIWMKDMNFPIDILWVRGDGVIVAKETHVSPSTYPKVFTPSEPVKYVIELSADFTDVYNVRVGDKVVF